MQRSNIIAHRGWWVDETEKNSSIALNRALEAGFGVETDVRDRAGVLVISHDPPGLGLMLTAEAFFDHYARTNAKGRLAVNIKAGGLQNELRSILENAKIDQSRLYVFDMAVPDALHYLRVAIPAYTRVSEYEKHASFLDKAHGVWIDNFIGGFPQVSEAQRLMEKGHRVCIVSSELHGRDLAPLWDEIVAAGLHKNPLFEICTDLPKRAHEMFGAD